MEGSLFLGAQAAESRVKSMPLDDRKALIFATHALLPGDLDGLEEPAIALSNPTITETGEDGLLTLGEVLGLELDADWVVLSACNMAAGGGKGAGAISGLGQAFFYAGTRALLVSHWPVETHSAKALTTDLFRRQGTDPSLSRVEALHRAVNHLRETGVRTDPESGGIRYTFAHPMFWAPFTLVGDGG